MPRGNSFKATRGVKLLRPGHAGTTTPTTSGRLSPKRYPRPAWWRKRNEITFTIPTDSLGRPS